MRRATWNVCVTLMFCLNVSFSHGQTSGALSGRVTDQSEAALEAAAVTAIDVDTGTSHATLTDRTGRYQLFALPAGLYEVQVRKNGFAVGIRTGIRLAVGQEAKADLELRIGLVNEQIKVTEDAAIVNLTTQDISGLVGERQVKDLPLNGRSYDLFLVLNPGVVNFTWEKTGGVGVSNSTTGNNFAVSGNRPQQNLNKKVPCQFVFAHAFRHSVLREISNSNCSQNGFVHKICTGHPFGIRRENCMRRIGHDLGCSRSSNHILTTQ